MHMPAIKLGLSLQRAQHIQDVNLGKCPCKDKWPEKFKFKQSPADYQAACQAGSDKAIQGFQHTYPNFQKALVASSCNSVQSFAAKNLQKQNAKT